jgi:hypothetical protein
MKIGVWTGTGYHEYEDVGTPTIKDGGVLVIHMWVNLEEVAMFRNWDRWARLKE